MNNQHTDLLTRADELRKQYQPQFADLDHLNTDVIAPLAYIGYVYGGLPSNAVKATWLQAAIRIAILVGREQSSTARATVQAAYDAYEIDRTIGYLSALLLDGQTTVRISDIKDNLEGARIMVSSTLPADVQGVLDAAVQFAERVGYDAGGAGQALMWAIEAYQEQKQS